jgi:hypothetical protein
MIVTTARAAAAASTVVILALGGCSSSGTGAAGASTKAGSTVASGATTSAANPATPTIPSGSGTPADAGTAAAVTKAYTTFFNPKTAEAQSEATLQHGPTFKDALDAASKTSQAQAVSATVSTVNQISADVAYVTFTLSVGGTAMLPNTHGYAVRDSGTWKVAAQTFCTLLQLQGTAPAACKDASITALPG